MKNIVKKIIYRVDRCSVDNKGYSLIVLVIAIVVIIILASSAISSLRASRQRTDIMNFIFDMNSMEEKVQSYYVQNGTLPTADKAAVDVEQLARNITANGQDGTIFKSQLSQYDNENYYYIDINRMGGVALREPHRSINGVDNGYIVNEGSLKVYVEKGIDYQLEGSPDTQTYFTLTSNLVNGQDIYVFEDEEIQVLGNPKTWVAKGELRVVLPRRSLSQSDWDKWKFKWDFGPKTVGELEKLNSSKNSFNYGDKLIVKSNGVYSILAQSPTGDKTVINVNVTKVDDIAPDYGFRDSGERITVIDKETGIKGITFKTLSTYKSNISEATIIETTNFDARRKNDFYLMDGSGDNLLVVLGSQIVEYANKKKEINAKIIEENEKWDEELAEYEGITLDEALDEQRIQRLKQHNDIINSYNNELTQLDLDYPYIADVDGMTDESKLVIYVFDYAGNAIVIGDNENETLSTRVLAKSYNISLTPLGI